MKQADRVVYRSKTLLQETMSAKFDVENILPLIYVSVGPLKPGDLLDIRSQIQATNDNTNVSLAWNMFTTLTYDGIKAGVEAPRYRLDYPTGRNLIRSLHHDGLTNSYIHEVQSEQQNAYVALCCTVEPLVRGPMKLVPLKMNYGCLTVVKHLNQ